MMREWRDIPGCEGRYQVSRDGYVRSLPDIDRRGRFMPGQILRPGLTDKGYEKVSIDGKHRRVHILVAEVYIPNPDRLPQVNHEDGVKRNNRWDNLKWVTNSQNQVHRYQVLGHAGPMKGRTGAKCPNSCPVRAIEVVTREVREYAGASEAARQLGIHASGIAHAAGGKSTTYKGWIWEWINR